jgi:hypothetical protein
MCGRIAASVVVFTLAVPALGVSVLRSAEPEKFGAGVTLTETTPVTALVKNPKAFDGKTVRVEGTVQAVCQEMGCWMALAAEGDSGSPLFVKVEEGVIRLPVRAKGHRAAAQGVVQRIGGGHEALEAAHEFAEATGGHAHHGEPGEMWQLKATGALVY